MRDYELWNASQSSKWRETFPEKTMLDFIFVCWALFLKKLLIKVLADIKESHRDEKNWEGMKNNKQGTLITWQYNVLLQNLKTMIRTTHSPFQKW